VKAVVCREFGPPERLVIEELADPQAGPGQVVIDVRATAVTFPDTLIIENRYQYKASPPFVPGGEAAGVVRALGDGVENFAVGDDVVVGGTPTGGFAEQLAAPHTALRRIPAGLGHAEATGFGYAYGTAYYGPKYRGNLVPGETLLVLGAAGSVGLAAVEIGKLLGARVIAAASTREKLELCRERGADDLVNYAEEDLKERAKALGAGKGIDVVYDAVGGRHAEAALRALAWRGRFLVIGFTAGIPQIPLNLTLLKGCQIVGVFYGASHVREPQIARAVTHELDELVAARRICPFVSRRYRLDETAAALRDMLERRVIGKVVVEP